jgi:four helix bundle protein
MTKTFEGLDAFTYALDLMVQVYEITEPFPKSEWYGLASQLRRASVSVVSNIAEGQGRLTDGEWRQHLSHARGSLFEIEAQLIAAERLGFIDPSIRDAVRQSAKRTAKPLAGLIAFVRKREASRATGHRQPST